MMKEKLEQYFFEHRESFIEHIRRLVRVRSVKGEPKEGMPFGEGPAAALKETLDIAEELGLLTKNFDNYVGTISINEQESKLGILGHVDVVGEGKNWTYDPYEGVIVDGKMYGRGTSDDKGPVIAAMYALAAVKDLGIPLSYNTKLIVGTDEESGMADLDYYLTKEKTPPYVFTPDAEFPVINIEKGAIRTSFDASFTPSEELPRVRSIRGGYKVNVVPPEAEAEIVGMLLPDISEIAHRITVETGVNFELRDMGQQLVHIKAIGVGGHASIPETAINAITGLLTLVNALPLQPSEGHRMLQGLSDIFPHNDYYGKAAGLDLEDKESGKLTMNFSIFSYNAEGHLEGQFDSRVPICATEANTFDVLEPKLAQYGIRLVRGGFEKPHHTPGDSPFVQTLLRVYEEYTGLKGECIAIGGGTYVHDIEGGVAFGPTMPGIDTRMHSNDEFIIIDDMLKASQIYAQVIVELCGTQS
ncbi:dipeptidase PepV [Paenibacillus septentrionalis]